MVLKGKKTSQRVLRPLSVECTGVRSVTKGVQMECGQKNNWQLESALKDLTVLNSNAFEVVAYVP
jgi:hypothetical protein